ncbi:MAG: U32 family peptidase [Spirochaetes bacterium]|nr:U32 family peptidase [Spirochaetota bacterium]
MKNNFEILLPAGSFESAIYSIEGGADALYLGLYSFSARKFAKNFSFIELRKLLNIAIKKKIKIYLTINTLILNNEIEKLLFILYYLSFFKIDAIIFQDFAIPELCEEFNFNFPLHASTQLACNNSFGALFLEKYYKYIEKIILPREFTLDNTESFIKNYSINSNYKRLFFEIFIHGALCYSFSGLCLASGVLTGRSGNRGECAQICRNFFYEKNKKIYPFSLVDLFYGEKINKIVNNNKINKFIKSFKIEGRMKSPEYCYWSSKLYKSILNDEANKKVDDLELLKRNLSLTFLREYGTPYINDKNGHNSININYPFHKGYYIGKLIKKSSSSFSFYTKYPISINDGFLIFNKKNNNYIIISVENLQKVNGENIKFTNGNEEVIVYSKKLVGFNLEDKFNELYHLSSRFLDLKKIKHQSFKDEEKINTNINLTINFSNEKNKILLNIKICGYLKSIYYKNIDFNFNYRIEFNELNQKEQEIKEKEIDLKEKKDLQLKKKIEEIFKKSHKSIFKIENILIELNSNNNFICFIPPNLIKKLKRTFYKDLTLSFINHFKLNFKTKIKNIFENKKYLIDSLNSILIFKNEKLNQINDLIQNSNFLEFINNREHLNPKNTFFNNKIPFFDPCTNDELISESTQNFCSSIKKLEIELIKNYNIYFIPLKPTIYEDEFYYFNILENIIHYFNINQNDKVENLFFIGISNIGQILPLENLLIKLQEKENIKNIYFFIDFYFYSTNTFNLNLIDKINKTLKEKILFVYPYIEYNFIINKNNKISKNQFYKKDYIPLFYSKNCFLRNIIYKNICPNNCAKKYKYSLIQNKTKFEVMVNNCTTYLFLDESLNNN